MRPRRTRSATADVFRNGTEVDVYYRDADNGIHESVYSDANGWSAPFELPATAGIATSSPAADVFWAGAEVDVYYRRTDGGVGESVYSDAHGWSSPGPQASPRRMRARGAVAFRGRAGTVTPPL